ncbi:MAG TPA: hypothetical protein VLL72_07605, partial [Kiloniellales bacterium]|nr:hypothetical protein [Kiloniellales bacterium]
TNEARGKVFGHRAAKVGQPNKFNRPGGKPISGLAGCYKPVGTWRMTLHARIRLSSDRGQPHEFNGFI